MKFLLAVVVLLGVYACETRGAKVSVSDPADSGESFVPSTLQPEPLLPSSRIVGGRNAATSQFPYQVSLRVRNSHICGGAIISPNYVVTAAHCVTDEVRGATRATSAALLTIRAGSTLVNSGGRVVGVSRVIVHPKYSDFNNDIALLQLSSALTFGDTIRAVPLATRDTTAGRPVVISGWGQLRTGAGLPTRLQYVTLTGLSNAACSRRIGSTPTSILCLAHSSGSGACQGDSGGPATYNGQLVGVTNFIIGRCGTSAPDGYAKISYHNQWLRDNSDL